MHTQPNAPHGDWARAPPRHARAQRATPQITADCGPARREKVAAWNDKRTRRRREMRWHRKAEGLASVFGRRLPRLTRISRRAVSLIDGQFALDAKSTARSTLFFVLFDIHERLPASA